VNNNPGSLFEFAGKQGSSVEKSYTDYHIRLAEYRDQLAQELGITLDELHLINNPCEKRSIEENEEESQ
jgi:hypothetical protein